MSAIHYDLVVFLFIWKWEVLDSNLVDDEFDTKLDCSLCSLAEFSLSLM